MNSRNIRILYAGVRNANYDARRGPSFEYQNFYRSLTRFPGAKVTEHPFDRILEVGWVAWNQELLEAVRREEPNLLFVFMYTDELDPRALDHIRAQGTKTLAWFADDYWRFWNYSRDWASHFSYVVTTSAQAYAWYHEAGLKNVIHSQWACNTALYAPRELPQDIDASFVGQRKSSRTRVVRVLERAGIRVEAFGSGWPNGRVSHDEMLRVFSRSKINLNLNDRPSLFDPRVLARLVLRKRVNRIMPDLRLSRNFAAYRHFAIPHIHARPFELSGCRAFTLSGYAEGIADYYAEGKEMAFYRTEGELIGKVRYYLAHEDERRRMSTAAYERTLREHTYEKRFRDIFKKIGLKI